MTFATPRAFPLGEPHPPGNPHAVSGSLPTWSSVVASGKGESWVKKKIDAGYPRFVIHKSINGLVRGVFARLQITDDVERCMIFPSAATASRFTSELTGESSNLQPLIRTVRFGLSQAQTSEETYWTSFHAVLFPIDMFGEAMKFWIDTGDGISSRHAEYCLKRLDYLNSESSDLSLRTQALKDKMTDSELTLTAIKPATTERQALRSLIAKLATSDQKGQAPVNPEDVFLYPKGMCAINAVSRALSALASGLDIVVFGWLYSESLRLLRRNKGQGLIYYGRGSEEELDELENALAGGKRIQVFFCEVPGNPHLQSVNMCRIGALAAQYEFIVACDETVGTFVNVDLLPYVDILMTSLTKMFSGGSDVMGGSVVLNPLSRKHDIIHASLISQYEDVCFPLDILTLHYNCANFVERSHGTNRNAAIVAKFLAAHPLIKQLNYPLFGPSAHLYEKYRRQHGGYGHLMSIVFHESSTAEHFYNALDLCKGSSFGTNFSLAIPYIQLAHQHEQEWAESYGVSKDIIRLSVGLEHEGQILNTLSRALAKAENPETPLVGECNST